jgi:hypothetical protein
VAGASGVPHLGGALLALRAPPHLGLPPRARPHALAAELADRADPLPRLHALGCDYRVAGAQHVLAAPDGCASPHPLLQLCMS